MNKNKIIHMVQFSIFASITLLMGLVPQLGFIVIPGGISITTVHIPVLIGAMLLPLTYASLLGLVFGVSSFIAAFIYAQGPMDYAFQNPMISIVPRIIFAIIAYFIILGAKKLLENKKNAPMVSLIIINIVTLGFVALLAYGLTLITSWTPLIIYSVGFVVFLGLAIAYFFYFSKLRYKSLSYVPTSFIISTLIHTLLVLTMIQLFKPEAFGDHEGFFALIIAVTSINGAIEALLAIIVGTPIVIALYSLMERKLKP